VYNVLGQGNRGQPLPVRTSHPGAARPAWLGMVFSEVVAWDDGLARPAMAWIPLWMQNDGVMGAWLAVTPRKGKPLRSCKAAPTQMA
ncbi:MAG TPA: hypothetical protein VFA18_13640, partial [Gemmataceae bacterium]|nr:hypothetical protein [Gemmataceae bacterium]